VQGRVDGAWPDRGVNSAAKTATVLAGMLSGADSIDDLDVLRAGGTRSSWTAWPGVLPLPRRPSRTVLDQSFCCKHSRQPFADLVAGTFELIGQEPVAELRIVLVRVH